MLGLKRLEADFTYAAAPAAFTAALDAVDGEGLLELGFQVEEAEMFVDLDIRMLLDMTVANDTLNITFFVDGVDVETVGTVGLWQDAILLADIPETVQLTKTLRLDKGFHTLQMRVKAPTGDVTVEGASIPAQLVARRHSHPATLGHGVDSKVQLVQ